MRNPFNWSYSKENFLKNREGNQGGTQRRHVFGEVETNEETSIQEPQPASQKGVRFFAAWRQAFFYAQTLLLKSITEKSNARRPYPKFDIFL